MKRLSPQSTFVCFAGIVLSLVVFSTAAFSQKASFGQQVAVMKSLKADLKVVGVVGTTISDKMTQDLTRAGMAQGITIVIAKGKDAREVASLYKKLVAEKKIQMLWVPDAGDDVVMKLGMDYLKENTVMDGVGLCVPVKTLG